MEQTLPGKMSLRGGTLRGGKLRGHGCEYKSFPNDLF